MFGVVGCMAGGRVDAPVLQGQVQGQRDIQEHNNIKPIRKYLFYFLIPKITPYQDSYPWFNGPGRLGGVVLLLFLAHAEPIFLPCGAIINPYLKNLSKATVKMPRKPPSHQITKSQPTISLKSYCETTKEPETSNSTHDPIFSSKATL